MTDRSEKVLLIGYGNPGRLDDGLGPALAEALESEDLPRVTLDADYQLTVEDAADVAKHDVVIFADASVNGPAPFEFRRIGPKSAMSFSSHSVSPEAVLAMAHEMFDARTVGYVLAVRGYEFNEFGESLSPRARENLAAAIEFVLRTLRSRNFSAQISGREERRADARSR